MDFKSQHCETITTQRDENHNRKYGMWHCLQDIQSAQVCYRCCQELKGRNILSSTPGVIWRHKLNQKHVLPNCLYKVRIRTQYKELPQLTETKVYETKNWIDPNNDKTILKEYTAVNMIVQTRLATMTSFHMTQWQDNTYTLKFYRPWEEVFTPDKLIQLIRGQEIFILPALRCPNCTNNPDPLPYVPKHIQIDDNQQDLKWICHQNAWYKQRPLDYTPRYQLINNTRKIDPTKMYRDDTSSLTARQSNNVTLFHTGRYCITSAAHLNAKKKEQNIVKNRT